MITEKQGNVTNIFFEINLFHIEMMVFICSPRIRRCRERQDHFEEILP